MTASSLILQPEDLSEPCQVTQASPSFRLLDLPMVPSPVVPIDLTRPRLLPELLLYLLPFLDQSTLYQLVLCNSDTLYLVSPRLYRTLTIGRKGQVEQLLSSVRPLMRLLLLRLFPPCSFPTPLARLEAFSYSYIS